MRSRFPPHVPTCGYVQTIASSRQESTPSATRPGAAGDGGLATDRASGPAVYPGLTRVQREAIARRFNQRWLQGYARGKLRHDPVYAAAVSEIAASPAPVLDIGCGIGLLAHHLRAIGCRNRYLGIDSDSRKISAARRAASSKAQISFHSLAARELPPWSGHVVMLDVLHYLDADRQRALLLAAVQRVAPGASLIIRNVIRNASWRFLLTRAEERVICAARWVRFRVRHYPTVEDLLGPIQSAELSVTMQPLWGNTPFNSYLAIARRPWEPSTP